MGGTSADIGIVTEDGIAEASARDTWIGGYPLLVPMLDVHTIGAGGGSIAYVDEGGAFRVGPRSAGADPGPACYGHGGEEPTISDAHVVLGRLDPQRFLGGRMTLDREAAVEAVGRLAEQLGLPLAETAEGILTIANSNMARAIRSRTIEKGHDPREFALVAFGGAGPLHAAEVADSLGIPEVLVPPYPGITSAAGLLTSDLKYDQMRTVFQLAGRGRRRAAEPRARRPRGRAARPARARRRGRVGDQRDPRARLPLRRPGLRAARHARRRPVHRGGARRVPPAARARVRQRVRRPDRDRQRARHRDRQAADAARAAGRERHLRGRRSSARARAISASAGSCRR